VSKGEKREGSSGGRKCYSVMVSQSHQTGGGDCKTLKVILGVNGKEMAGKGKIARISLQNLFQRKNHGEKSEQGNVSMK